MSSVKALTVESASDKIQSKATSQKYADGYDRIFGKKTPFNVTRPFERGEDERLSSVLN